MKYQPKNTTTSLQGCSLENTTWKIDKSKINIELAQFIIDTVNHVLMKDSLNLMKEGTYRTFTDDMMWKISFHENGYVVVTDKRANVVHWGMFHLMKDKLKELYPSLQNV